MVTRRRLVIALGAGALVAPRASFAQEQSKLFRIGYLSSGDKAGSTHLTQAFVDGLRDLGYVEGKNLIIESRYADGNVDRLPTLARELIEQRVDVIFAPSSPSTLAAKHLTDTVPIVFCWLSDPVGSGAVSNLAHPGGNVTGLSTLHRELSAKRLQLLKETFPNAKRVAAMVQAGHPATAGQVREMESAANILGLRFYPIELAAPDDIESGFGKIRSNNIDSLIVIVSPITFVNRKRIVALSEKDRVPTIYDMTEPVEEGGLMSFSVDMSEQFRRAAVYVDKILKGAKPADLPVEQPTKFELIINAKTAKTLDLAIPPSLLLRADKVIE
jgi:ABC-type uncharacterized transport system substrate-binding protein